MEALTTGKADETMLLPLAQKMSKVLDRCKSKQIPTELVAGLGRGGRSTESKLNHSR